MSDPVLARLTDLHRATDVGDRRQFRFPPVMAIERRKDLAIGAGFAVVHGVGGRVTTLERQWSLPDTVGPGMGVLVCGLNPSPAAADDGIGFARPGNRFWPAALAAGLASVDRDPDHALEHHGMGMTDLVKRTTRRAAELAATEYVDGVARLRRLTGWLRPGAVCFVGLAGWRAAVDAKATSGWQTTGLGAVPVYLMPSTSGLNASTQLDGFIEHLSAVRAGP